MWLDPNMGQVQIWDRFEGNEILSTEVPCDQNG